MNHISHVNLDRFPQPVENTPLVSDNEQFEIDETRRLIGELNDVWSPLLKGHTDLAAILEDSVDRLKAECDRLEEFGR